MSEPADGRSPILKPGLCYLPQFISQDESKELIEHFGELSPLWEQRHRDDQSERSTSHTRRLTRPVYWLGAWQFACLGYYSEPDYREHRCLRGEPLTPVMQSILERLQPMLAQYHESVPHWQSPSLPNSCLINYYGREVLDGKPPRDYARLRMHRDSEPGPVILFCIGQAGLLEFLEPSRPKAPELSVWTRHRSVAIFSGPEFKERLYHRVSRVRTGALPVMHTQLANFELRRISVSFRNVPDELIEDFGQFPEESRRQVRGYVQELAQNSEHYDKQLALDVGTHSS